MAALNYSVSEEKYKHMLEELARSQQKSESMLLKELIAEAYKVNRQINRETGSR